MNNSRSRFSHHELADPEEQGAGSSGVRVRSSACPGGLLAYAVVLASAAFAGFQLHGAAEAMLAQHAALAVPAAPEPTVAAGAKVALSEPADSKVAD